MTTPKKTLPRGGSVAYIRLEDYLGKKFGRLTVICKLCSRAKGYALYHKKMEAIRAAKTK